MELYVDGRINGGSFLVAGHRGSGKTWIVHKAIEMLQFVAPKKRETPVTPLARYFPRPLLVRIHGPDLLISTKLLGASEPDKSPKSHFRAQIALALHRALCEEIAHSYIEHAVTADTRSPTPKDAHELAAQFQIELDRSPSPERLRHFWERLNKTDSGIVPRINTKLRSSSESLRNPMNQGWKELVALATAFHVQSEIARQRRESSPTEPDASAEEERQADTGGGHHAGVLEGISKFMLHRGAAINRVFGLVAGLVIFAALMEMHVHLAVSLLTAFFGAATTTVLLNFSAAYDQRSTFVTDHSVAALDRMLPLLVRRIREAGLHPVFVVDELDKVDDLRNRMEEFMKDLRFFVTEQAFCCFLADREFFDELMESRRSAPYAVEDTFFTEMVFVNYSPRDLTQYLDDLLESDSDI
jgi:hypothetical protein